MNGVLAEIGRIEPLVRVLWGGVALLALALVTLLVILEGRHFRGRGLARPWAWLRAASLPCLAAALLSISLNPFVFALIDRMGGKPKPPTKEPTPVTALI